MSRPITIWFTDFSHEANDYKTHPYGVGCVATFAKKHLGDDVTLRLFKCPEVFARAAIAKPPDIVGMRNGIWNSKLDYAVTTRLKRIKPDCVVVYGGPHYPEDPSRQEAYLRKNPLIDFYVHREGEIPFLFLARKLLEFGLDAAELKKSRARIDGVHYISKDRMVAGLTPGIPPRPKNLDDIPSPYLQGLLDEFFPTPVHPLMQYARGCPFACTFCTEGHNYHNKIRAYSFERYHQDLSYIAANVTKHHKVASNLVLHFADANFGMTREYVEVCRLIRDVQDRYGWPERIDTALGKNKPENIFNAISQLKYGTLWYGAAFQSTDEEVLENIKRKNISLDKLMESAHRSADYNRGSNSEIILNLPGDSKVKHLKTLRTIMEADISRIRMYPLLLLPGTEVESAADRNRFSIRTHWRVVLRSFGSYRWGDEVYPSAETGEMVTATSAMPYEDYIYCRLFDLSVELFYNDKYFMEVEGLLAWLGISMFDFVDRAHRIMLEDAAGGLRGLYDGFTKSITKEMWSSEDELDEFIQGGGNLERYREIEHESSLATNRAIGVLSYSEGLHRTARLALDSLLKERAVAVEGLQEYVDEMFRFSLGRKSRLLDLGLEFQEALHFDFDKLLKQRFRCSPFDFRLAEPTIYSFRQEDHIGEEMQRLYSKGRSPALGMRNILYYSVAAAPVDYFFRKYQFRPVAALANETPAIAGAAMATT